MHYQRLKKRIQFLVILRSFFNEESPFNAYGYGWVVSQYRNKTLFEHGSAVDGFCAVIALVPEENLGIVVL